LSHRTAGNRSIDVRPEPERVCPPEGCQATSVGAVIVIKDTTCALVAVIAGPGKSAAHLVPWAGKVELTQDTVPFREPPEGRVKVRDWVSCATLLDGRENDETVISRQIAKLMP